MKTFDYALDEYQVSALYSSFRKKEDIIKLWMKSIKLAISYVPPEPRDAVGLMRIHIDKMSRLFIKNGNKSFSVNFPFRVTKDDIRLQFYSHSCDDIDSRVTSEVLSLLDTEGLLSKDSIWDFAEPLDQVCQNDPQIWRLVRDLMIADDGYVRLDHDQERYNGNLHPLDHVDIFYSSGATFKIGLNDKISLDNLLDILDIQTDCRFLQ